MGSLRPSLSLRGNGLKDLLIPENYRRDILLPAHKSVSLKVYLQNGQELYFLM